MPRSLSCSLQGSSSVVVCFSTGSPCLPDQRQGQQTTDPRGEAGCAVLPGAAPVAELGSRCTVLAGHLGGGHLGPAAAPERQQRRDPRGAARLMLGTTKHTSPLLRCRLDRMTMYNQTIIRVCWECLAHVQVTNRCLWSAFQGGRLLAVCLVASDWRGRACDSRRASSAPRCLPPS